MVTKKKTVRKKKPAKKKPALKRKIKPSLKKKKPSVKKRSTAKKTPKKPSNEILVGKVTHYFPHVEAAVIKITKDKISSGNTLHIKGHSSDFTQVADSLQIDRVPVNSAKKGEEIGLKVKFRVREHDLVYRVKP